MKKQYMTALLMFFFTSQAWAVGFFDCFDNSAPVGQPNILTVTVASGDEGGIYGAFTDNRTMLGEGSVLKGTYQSDSTSSVWHYSGLQFQSKEFNIYTDASVSVENGVITQVVFWKPSGSIQLIRPRFSNCKPSSDK